MKSLLSTGALLLLAGSAFAQAVVPNPVVSGPVTGGARGTPLMASYFDLGTWGYVEQEFFTEGTATAYTLNPQTTAAYKTRILVRRPLDPQRFNGTVYVEWMNVTGGVSLDPDWAVGQRELLRSGYAYVGVDAQALGVNVLRGWDPLRYGSLVHPGDDYSFAIYAQVAKALGQPLGVDPMGGLAAVRVLAMGESQSGGRLNTYVNSVHPQVVPVFDGFMIGGSNSMIADLAGLDVPVLRFNSDFDVGGNAQPDGDFYRVWEMGGSGHNTFYYSSYASAVTMRDLGIPFAENDQSGVCLVNRYPKQLVFRSVLHHLNQWVARGIAPPSAPRISFTGAVRDVDEFGNSVGGIRLPAVEVPVAAYNRGPACGATAGSTQYFDAAALAALYPAQADYDAAVRAAQDAAVSAGSSCPPTGCSARPSIRTARRGHRDLRARRLRLRRGGRGGRQLPVRAEHRTGGRRRCRERGGRRDRRRVSVRRRQRQRDRRRPGRECDQAPRARRPAESAVPRARQLRRHGQRRLQRAGRERGEAHCARPAHPAVRAELSPCARHSRAAGPVSGAGRLRNAVPGVHWAARLPRPGREG